MPSSGGSPRARAAARMSKPRCRSSSAGSISAGALFGLLVTLFASSWAGAAPVQIAVSAALLTALAAPLLDEAAIALWLRSVEERYSPRYQLRQVEADKDRTIVTFQVSGTFPGSPAVLRQAFTFDSQQRIASLETL